MIKDEADMERLAGLIDLVRNASLKGKRVTPARLMMGTPWGGVDFTIDLEGNVTLHSEVPPDLQSEVVEYLRKKLHGGRGGWTNGR